MDVIGNIRSKYDGIIGLDAKEWGEVSDESDASGSDVATGGNLGGSGRALIIP